MRKRKGIYKRVLRRVSVIQGLIERYHRMTIRQIYYKLLGTADECNYERVTYACKQGRRHGLIDYNSIVDRTRPVYGPQLFKDLEPFKAKVPDWFYLDYWDESEIRPQIWTEKDALSQELYEEATKYNVPVYVTRGFLSISSKSRWGGDNIAVLYFGDFDPSGLWVDIDLEAEESGMECETFERIALTHGMTKDLPSVPVNRSDPRAKAYTKEYGTRCWELDALDPDELRALVRRSIERFVDFDLEEKMNLQSDLRDELRENMEK